MLLYVLFLAIGCTPPAEKEQGDTQDTDTAAPPVVEPYSLETGYYLVASALTPENQCEGDFSDYQGKKWRVWVTDEGLDVEGLIMAREVNSLSGTEVEVNDWQVIGADCVTQTDSIFTGEVVSDTQFDWRWTITWSYVDGDGCDAALNMEMPCTYDGDFVMTYDSPLEAE